MAHYPYSPRPGAPEVAEPAYNRAQSDGNPEHARGVPPAFRFPKYRAYWAGLFVSVIGFQVFQFVQFLLVHTIDDSVLTLGYLGLANALPTIILALVGGVFADKLDKRRLIVVTQSVSGCCVLALAVLTLSGVVAVWHVLVLATVISGVSAFDSPARAAYYPRLVDRAAMLSAVALNSTVWQSTRIIGPGFAGIAVARLGRTDVEGIGLALLASSAGFFFMTAVMIALRVQAPGESRGNPARNLLEGLDYAKSNAVVLFLVVMAFTYSFFGWSFVVLMPVLARDVLGVDAAAQGWLLAGAGVGATVVTVGLALSGGRTSRYRGRLVIGGAATFGVLVAVFALTSEYVGSYPLALFLMVALGLTQTLYSTASMASLQLVVPDRMRGRVFGLYSIMWGIMPLSGTQAAFLANFVGVPIAVAFGGLMVTLFALGPALMNPRIRRLGAEPLASGG